MLFLGITFHDFLKKLEPKNDESVYLKTEKQNKILYNLGNPMVIQLIYINKKLGKKLHKLQQIVLITKNDYFYWLIFETLFSAFLNFSKRHRILI